MPGPGKSCEDLINSTIAVKMANLFLNKCWELKGLSFYNLRINIYRTFYFDVKISLSNTYFSLILKF